MRSGDRAALALACALLLPCAAAQATPAACASPSYRQFDFWIGTWDVLTPDGRRAGTNTIEPIAGGCALLESWTGADGGTGKSLNRFDRRDERWHQSWVDASGSRLELAGRAGPGRMVLESEGQRIAWTVEDGGSVRQLWERRDAATGAWTVVFDGRYVKTR